MAKGYDGMRKKDASHTGGKLLDTVKKPTTSSRKPSVPGYNYPSGTPKYIDQAAKAAERRTSVGTLDCGYGKQEVHRSHRMPLGGAGKPDVAKDQSYRNPTKETK